MMWSEIRTASRLRLGDTSGKIWTNAELLKYANEALDELTVRSKATIHRIFFTLTDGTRTYTMPDNFHELRSIRINGQPANGTTRAELEEIDLQYLTRTGTSEWYYMEDTKTIGFYKVPTWTDDYTGATFSDEDGIVTSIEEGSTYYTFDSEYGIILGIVDDAMSEKFIIDSWDGETVAINDGPLNVEIEYVYQPVHVSGDYDVPDLPAYMHYAMVYSICAQALARRGQAQNKAMASFYSGFFKEWAQDWRGRNLNWSHGQAQMYTQRPAQVGSAYDWRTRLGGH